MLCVKIFPNPKRFVSKFQGASAIEALGEGFYDRVAPADFNLVGARYFDEDLSRSIGLELSQDQLVDHFLRFEPLSGSLKTPLALRYHGHQFRHYNPCLLYTSPSPRDRQKSRMPSSA